MTAKLIRHPDQLVLVGAPTSAGAAAAGVEHGPTALRETGILDRLKEVGYQVNDVGDLPAQVFQPDPDNPRARNLKGVLAMLDVLRLRIEQAARAHAFPLVLGGDATVLVALVAGLRRQAPSLGLIHISRSADLHTPTRTDDGLVGPMTVSHLVGQGAAEMVRFWKSPPLVREPDLSVFGLHEPDPIDQERLADVAVRNFTVARIRSEGARAAAEAALALLRAETRDFVVHISMDAFQPEEVPGCARGTEGGLTTAELGDALNCFAAREKFAGLSISGYDPALDPDRRGAKAVAELVIQAMAARHTALLTPPTETEEKPATDEDNAGDATQATPAEQATPATAESSHDGDAQPANGAVDQTAATTPATAGETEATPPSPMPSDSEPATPEPESSAAASPSESETKNT